MRTKKTSWRDEKVMSRKEFNRDFMVRFRAFNMALGTYNWLVGYDQLRRLLGSDEVFENTLKKASYYSYHRGNKVVIHPFHFVEVTFIAH